MKQLPLPHNALSCITEIIEHHEMLEEYACLQAGLPLKEEIGNYKELKQKIESDYRQFVEIINHLGDAKLISRSELSCYSDEDE